MKLYEIDQALLECIDPETGEIVDVDRLNELQIERDTKIENVVCWIKNLEAESKAIKDEIESLKKRKDSNDKKAESLKNWISFVLEGQKFSTGKCSVSFRSSQSVVVDEEVIPKKWFVKKITMAVDKAGIKEVLKNGGKIKGAALIEKINPQIK